jgi:D-alanyl-D-alanine carboxypeptidase (penicillin-binding protein 5/6)
MNKIAFKLALSGSNFANPHGLSNPNNYSCAEDMAKICGYAMKNTTFRRIVQTKARNFSYRCY